jgi:anti-sigma factor RsiW
MCNNELLIGYLYDDLSAADRAAFEAHLAGCAACRREVEDLGQTRQHLASWAPPEPVVNFRVVRSASSPPVKRWTAAIPQWALAAAASLLVVAGAAALANLEVRYGSDGLVVRTGWQESAAVVPPAPAVSQSAASEQMAATIAQLTERLAQLESQKAAPTVVSAASHAPNVVSTPELRKILVEYEKRQRAELAVQIRHLWTDINAIRAADFDRVQRAFAPEFQRTQRTIETQQRTLDSIMYRTAQYK